MAKLFTQSLLAVLLSASSGAALAQGTDWRFSEVSGSVQIRHGATTQAARRGMTVPPGAMVLTGSSASAVLVRDKDFVTIAASSRLAVPAEEKGGLIRMIQDWGNAVFRIEKQGKPRFAVDTPYLAAVVKGTTFSVTVSAAGSSLQVTEGLVEVASLDGGARDLIRPGAIAMISADDRYRLSITGDQQRVIDSPQRPKEDITPAPAPTEAQDVELKPARESTSVERVETAFVSRPVDLSAVTGGLLRGQAGVELASLVAPAGAAARGNDDAPADGGATPGAPAPGNGQGSGNGNGRPNDDGNGPGNDSAPGAGNGNGNGQGSGNGNGQGAGNGNGGPGSGGGNGTGNGDVPGADNGNGNGVPGNGGGNGPGNGNGNAPDAGNGNGGGNGQGSGNGNGGSGSGGGNGPDNGDVPGAGNGPDNGDVPGAGNGNGNGAPGNGGGNGPGNGNGNAPDAGNDNGNGQGAGNGNGGPGNGGAPATGVGASPGVGNGNAPGAGNGPDAGSGIETPGNQEPGPNVGGGNGGGAVPGRGPGNAGGAGGGNGGGGADGAAPPKGGEGRPRPR